ncbi:MAG: WGR domain-containing protein [Ardenticatenaceae bacterium]
MKPERITLYFKQGKSDKVYKVSLEETESKQFVVNFAYGRRGATLRTGTKTKKPVSYASAKKAYDKLVKSKTSKGYKPGEQSSQYVHTDADSRETGVQCQLLNFVEDSQVAQLINNDEWWAQEKHDGKRMLIRKADSMTAINRKGLSVGAPEPMLNSARRVEHSYLVDGEAVGEKLFAFDLLELDQSDLKPTPYRQRQSDLERLGFDGSIVVVETAKTTAQKQSLYDRLQAAGAEGIVFKQHSAPYTAGRPNSGGTQLKFKFYATASVIVSKINDKRSVGMELLAGQNQAGTEPIERVFVGNVTIPSNKEVPAVNSIIEVRYLYAYKGGSLYQPTYLGLRDDISFDHCLISQLKYKQETA